MDFPAGSIHLYQKRTAKKGPFTVLASFTPSATLPRTPRGKQMAMGRRWPVEGLEGQMF